MGRKPKDTKEFIPLDFVINDAIAIRMNKALKVIATDPNIKSFLINNDMKALIQVENAIFEYESSYQESNIDQ